MFSNFVSNDIENIILNLNLVYMVKDMTFNALKLINIPFLPTKMTLLLNDNTRF